MFEWDEQKRLWTIKERSLDFVDATAIFDGRRIVHIAARAKGEDRVLSIAKIGGKVHTVVWAWRGDVRRIISFRRSRDDEEESCRSLHH